MFILGISAFYHDSAACIIKDGIILAAAQEERFTRIKHDSNFPHLAIKYCVEESGVKESDIDFFVFYEKPFPKFERLLETYLAFAPRGFSSFATSMPLWIKEKLFQKSIIKSELSQIFYKDINFEKKLLFSDHHLSHAASAFFPSPFKNAAVLTMDGVGEWATSSIAIGNQNKLQVINEISFPHSLGLLYSAITYYIGFKVNSGEYKVMGLAPYGIPKFVNTIKDNLIDIKDDGSFHLNMDYFDYCTGLKMTNKKFDNLFGGMPREKESLISQREMDIAASIQKVTEEVILKICKNIKLKTKEENLCLAGGVALNCVANGILLKENIFKGFWVQPASGDAGGALGAALAIYYLKLNKTREPDGINDYMMGSYLGPKYTDKEIEISLNKIGANYTRFTKKEIIKKTALYLSEGKAVGWINGRMEFGPRALGARSILADPRSPKMQKQLNLKVKYRESFRPFAPSILFEYVEKWFKLKTKSPYMLLVSDIVDDKKIEMTSDQKMLFGIDKLNVQKSSIPAVTHINYSARVQTVHKDTSPSFHSLITEFKNITGCPVLVNTSFNVRGEPIVMSPEDGFKCFMGTELDILVIENFILIKDDQDPSLKENYENKYKLD